MRYPTAFLAGANLFGLNPIPNSKGDLGVTKRGGRLTSRQWACSRPHFHFTCISSVRLTLLSSHRRAYLSFIAIMSLPGIITVANETDSSMTRLTRDGRRLLYTMKVLQQPQRARACGSGAKCKCAGDMRNDTFLMAMIASADRRPVDPPPVVELKIYQLEGDRKIDCTFTHEANFILYTTLETARSIAQPRGNGNSIAPPAPVLSGAAVAGIAYLDRPNPAGYFIFPDLSVRHEGSYRLSFNLFEELKNTADADADESTNPSVVQTLRSPGMADVRHVHFRLEVKSEPFQVYSAKKFPGLAESTPLSRAVADQGCRVRIRRDVRMRRRDPKHSKEEYTTNDTSSRGTPELLSSKPASERERSMSNTTNEVPACTLMERRPSQELYYQSTYPPTSEAHGSTINSPVCRSYGTPGRQHVAVPMPPTPHCVPPAATAAYSYQTYQNKGYDVPPEYSPTTYEMEPRSSFDCPRSSHSASGSSSHAPLSSSYSSLESKRSSTTSLHSLHSQQSQHSHGSFHSIPRPCSVDGTFVPEVQLLPSLKSGHFPEVRPLQQQQHHHHHHHHYQQQLPHPQSYANPYPSNAAISTTELPPYHMTFPTAIDPSPTLPQSSSARDITVMLGKRVHGEVFDTSSLMQPAWGGQRPELASHGIDLPQFTLDDGLLADLREHTNIMEYKRADGSRQLKKCPAAA